ncbi:MAG: plasmid pRiA4b ORF-3 family protein [Clostridiales bacterium]|nr:plasmid pRiA4b ORF-3 family protein [Clostridiales bacterium]
MLIQCTKKLLDQLDVKPKLQQEEEALFSWHANLLTVFRRKAVVLVNDKNRYIVVLHGLKAKHFKKLNEHIIEAIRTTFRDECIKEEIIEKFINHSNGINYTKTKNRSMIAKMNKACELLDYHDELLKGSSIYKTNMGIRASQYLVGKDYIHPYEELYKDLEVFAGDTIFRCKAVEIKVTLELEKQEVWRKLIIPTNNTFTKLHKVIQIAFGWQDYHLHDFYIYDESTSDVSINHPGYHKDGYKPIVNIACDEEAFVYKSDDIEMKLETGIRLSDYMPAKIKYVYDFGDNWQHYIEVEKVIEEYDKNYSVCIDGKGNTPPEDVGGEYGYEEFLEIVGDKNNLEYENMLAWGTSQGYEDFDIEKVNKKIKSRYE